MYAKLINGALQIAPNKITKDNLNIWNPPSELYLEQGWKLVILTESPEPPTGYYYEEDWEEQEETITQVWILKELPDDVDDSEALKILLGGTIE